MSERNTTTAVPTQPPEKAAGGVRRALREQGQRLALTNALAKRAAGVPSYTIPEAAALLSISPEHLYRLVHADAFPAVRMRCGGEQGRYVIPAKAVDQLLDGTAEAGLCVEVADFTHAWHTTTAVAGNGRPRGGDAA